MPKITQDAGEQTRNPLEALIAAGGAQFSIGAPMLFCGVNRKINIGNYENIDVYSALSVPVFALPNDLEAFRQAVVEASELGFSLTSQETFQRYAAIKEMQSAGRGK